MGRRTGSGGGKVAKVDQFWAEGSFVRKVEPEGREDRMKTFHKSHDEDMNSACRKCGTKISDHNRDWHDGMCDGCFFDTHFPESGKKA